MARADEQLKTDVLEMVELTDDDIEGIAGGGEDALERYNGCVCSACGKTNTICTALTELYFEYTCNSCQHKGIENRQSMDDLTLPFPP